MFLSLDGITRRENISQMHKSTSNADLKLLPQFLNGLATKFEKHNLFDVMCGSGPSMIARTIKAYTQAEGFVDVLRFRITMVIAYTIPSCNYVPVPRSWAGKVYSCPITSALAALSAPQEPPCRRYVRVLA